MPPFVIQIFSPFSVQLPSGFFSACVRIDAASEPGGRFGQAERRDHFAARELRQVAGFLRLGAEHQDALHADRAVRADRQRHRAVMAAGLGEHARISRVRQPEAAMLLGDDQAEQAELAQPLDEFRGLLRLAIPAPEVRMLAARGTDRSLRRSCPALRDPRPLSSDKGSGCRRVSARKTDSSPCSSRAPIARCGRSPDWPSLCARRRMTIRRTNRPRSASAGR